MIHKTDILKMTRHVFKRSQNIPDKRLLHPQRDWFFGVLMFICVLLAGGALSAYNFFAFQDINLDTLVTEKDLPVYQQQLVQNQLLQYEDRKIAYDTLRNQKQAISEEDIDTASSTATSTPDLQINDESEQTEERESEVEVEEVAEGESSSSSGIDLVN